MVPYYLPFPQTLVPTMTHARPFHCNTVASTNMNPSRLIPDKRNGIKQNSPQLFVANYPYSKTTIDLRAQFSQLGEIAVAYLIPNKDTTGHKGYGFVSYKNPQVAFHAVLHFRGMHMNRSGSSIVNPITARQLDVDLTYQFKLIHRLPVNRKFEKGDFPYVNRAIRFLTNEMCMLPQQQMTKFLRMQQQLGRRNNQMPQIFFSNVPYSVTENQLVSIFSKFGSINQLYLIADVQHGNRHKGFGFLSFLTRGSPEACYYGMKNFVIHGRKIDVDFSKKYKNQYLVR